MADNNLPPLHEDDTEETIKSGLDVTRPNTPIGKEATEQNVRHRTEVLHKAEPTRQNRPAPKGSHVQPVAGTRPRQSAPAGYAPRSKQRRRTEAKDSALYLPWWSIALMLVGVLIVSFGFVGGVILLGGSGSFLAEPSPIIVIVTADPAAIDAFNTQAVQQQQAPSTEIISGQNAPQNLELAGPTLAPVQISPTPAAIQIGSVVAVEGVDLDTLNVRTSPSLSESSILFRAAEAEIFNVVDGPRQSDGFTWWQIQDPADVNRKGWAVSNFLTVQAP